MEQHVLVHELLEKRYGFDKRFPGRSQMEYMNIESLKPEKLDSTAVVLLTYSKGPYFNMPNLKYHAEHIELKNIPSISFYDSLGLGFIHPTTISELDPVMDLIEKKLAKPVFWKGKKRKALEEGAAKYLLDVRSDSLYMLYKSIANGTYPIRIEPVKEASELVRTVSEKLGDFTCPDINAINTRLGEIYLAHFNEILPKEETVAA